MQVLLPWEYGVRNLSRRPMRTFLTLAALTLVIGLVFVLVAFIRGLERSLAASGDPDVVMVYSLTSEENLENSSIAARTPQLLQASIEPPVRRYGVNHVSPELFFGTRIGFGDGQAGFGLVRGVTVTAPLVRRTVRLTGGRWPQAGEVIIGRLAAAKVGGTSSALSIGQSVTFEGQSWTVVGTFDAAGSAYESEIWCRLEDFQLASKRQDLSVVAILLPPGAPGEPIQQFCERRVDLELVAVRESDYYAALQQFYQPVRAVAWLVVWLVSGAGVFTGLNMMYGAVSGRVREIATLQAIGFRRPAILISILQEGMLLSAAAALLAGTLALLVVDGLAVKFTMGAFRMRVDGLAILVGCGIGLLLGILGSLPPAIKSLRAEVASGLKAF